MNFCSDNVTGCSPEVITALTQVAQGSAMPYGDDEWTTSVERRLAELFETDVSVFLVATGTAANSLALAAMTPPYRSIYCHEESHINCDECSAPEFFTDGAKLMPLPGDGAKLDATVVTNALNMVKPGVHWVQPGALSITQASEAGTIYSASEIAALAEIAHGHDIKLHVDGARFANAVAALGCTPAEITWKAGVDVLSFGATKNGAMAAEAVVIFDQDLVPDFDVRRKRAGHLFSKMRFLAAQWDAYLTDDLWLRNAQHANAMTQRLADGLSAIPGAAITRPPQTNELFIILPEPTIVALETAGFKFYRWSGATPGLIRLVTAFSTTTQSVDALIDAAKKALS